MRITLKKTTKSPSRSGKQTTMPKNTIGLIKTKKTPQVITESIKHNKM
jgi:hypothetical protein